MTGDIQTDIADDNTNLNMLKVGDLAVYGRADGRYPLALGRIESIGDDGRCAMQDISTHREIDSARYHVHPVKVKLLQYKFIDDKLDEICHSVSPHTIHEILDIPEKDWSARKRNHDILGQTYAVGDLVIHTIEPLYNRVHLGQIIQIDIGRSELIISGSAYGEMINVHISFNQACIVQLSDEDKEAIKDIKKDELMEFYLARFK
jgi:hypothetical protein